MGFFSSVRKFFGGETTAPTEAAQPISLETPPADSSVSDEELTLALRSAEPRLSSWLAVVLQDVDSASDLLWYRIAFLLRALDLAPKN